jgi:hypothetical protein
LAAAIRTGAQVIVTVNQRDFPNTELAIFDIEAQRPDMFVLHLLSRDAGAVLKAVRVQAESLKNPPMTVEQLLEVLESRGLVQSVTEMRKYM